jgi:A/G-specific adenine glycosylase
MAKNGKPQKDGTKSAGSTEVILDAGFVCDLQEEILAWFAQNGRDLPWRRTRDPYAIFVSELMLQQTQASRVIPKYETFIERLPTPDSLAKAPLGEVLLLWSGLGYNRRAQYLHRAAQVILSEYGGRFPQKLEEIRSLPGAGPYTAGAVAAFAFNSDVIILETNIRRIYQLLFTGEDASEATNREVAGALLPSGRARDWYHALMDLATDVRTSRSAAVQQQRLKELFPLLSEHDFPSIAGERLERPRQSVFLGSHRFFRGQILRRLQDGPSPSREISRDLDSEQVARALEALTREGLIVYEPFHDRFRLP